MKFEVPQRQQLASKRTSLTLFAPAPSTISSVPLTRNLSLANPSPTRGGQASQKQLPPASKYPSIAQRAPCSNRQTGQRVSVREIRYRKQPPTVRKEYSVPEIASSGTRRIFRDIRCKKQAFPVRKGYSVRKTGFCGTRCVFKGAQNSTCYIERFSKARETADSTDCGQPPGVRDAFSKACRAKSSTCRSGSRFSARNAHRSEVSKYKSG